ncbi:MAG: sensor histidine kinase [Dehalococcoidia bacterium]
MTLSRHSTNDIDHRWWSYARLPDWRVVAVGGLILAAANAPMSALLEADARSDLPQHVALWLVANIAAVAGSASAGAGLTWVLSRGRTILIRAPFNPVLSYALYATAGLFGGVMRLGAITALGIGSSGVGVAAVHVASIVVGTMMVGVVANLQLGYMERVRQQEQELAERRAVNSRLQRLSWRLADSKEEQSRMIARELHDEIGQELTGLKLNLEIGDANALETARRITRDLMQRVRSLSLELRPIVLDDLGLVPALHQMLARFTELTKVRVHLSVDGLDQRFDPAVEVAAYRIVQEALTNVARHAQVDEAFVSLGFDGGLLRLDIEDAGRGVPPPDSRGDDSSSGLSGMLERARALGGSMEIDGGPGEGTHIVARLPLPHDLEPGQHDSET